MTAFIVTLVVAGNVLGTGMALPQAVRIVRTGDTNGVSGMWAGVSIAMNLWWLTYGIANHIWGLVPTSALAAVLYGVIASSFVRARGARAAGRIAVGSIGVGAVPAAALLIGGWTAAGLAIGLCYGLQLAPAVVASLRTRELSGVAAATWLMAWGEALIWSIYGVFVADIALLSGGGSGFVMATVILVRLAVTGHQPFRVRRIVPASV